MSPDVRIEPGISYDLYHDTTFCELDTNALLFYTIVVVFVVNVYLYTDRVHYDGPINR